MGKKTPPKEEAEGSPPKKAPRVGDAAPVKDPVASAPSPTGKTPPKGEDAEGSPKKAPRVDDAAPVKDPVASARSPTGKTPPKGEEPEGSPRKKAPRVGDTALATAPGASKADPTGESTPKEEAERSPPKRARSPRKRSSRPMDKHPAMRRAQPLATVPELSELTGEAAKGASDEKRCKCNHVITESAAKDLVRSVASEKEPEHAAWACCGCRHEDEKRIAKTRPEKTDLLICVTCYQLLCCGVGSIAYPFGHSRAHALKEEHCFAVLFCDPERGYCFECNAEVPMPVKFGDGDNEAVLEQIRCNKARLLQGLRPSVGQTEVEVNPKVEMTVKVQAERGPSGFDVDLADKWPSYESRSSDSQGYAIRGIPNLGNTCYMSAVLQCLFVLGKLRERMLALDRPKNPLAKALKELFVEASAAGDMLNPKIVLDHVHDGCVNGGRETDFRVGVQQDSHELLEVFRLVWEQGEEIYYNRQSDDPTVFDSNPTVFDSIFGFKTTQTISCKKCGYFSPKSHVLWDLKLDFPLKWHPTESAASLTTNKSPRSQKREIAVQLFPDVQRYLEPMQTVSKIGYPHVIGSEVIAEETHKPSKVDSTQAQCISQRKDVVESPWQIQEGKSVDSLTEGFISIEDFLLLFLEEEKVLDWKCDNCAKNHEEPSASQSKNGVKVHRLAMLPPVLTLHINRTSHLKDTPEGGNTDGLKISVHVRFMEYLDVAQLMDPSSVDKGSTLYRLAGVVEHIGEDTLKEGHYIAYVRARRLGNQQEGSSCSSSWFRADDSWIRQVTLEQVLNQQAYILFYERMEDQDISGIRRQE